MSSKFIHSLSDDNPDLHKQIGCMNGIFQLFDRHHFLSGRRQITGQNHKRFSHQDVYFQCQNGNNGIDSKNVSKKTTERNHKQSMKEKQRISTESSKTSFSSSSCSSSLSSLECNRAASQLEISSSTQTIVPETQVRESPIHQPNACFRSSQQFPDLRDVVKDSIYREARGLSVKTVSKGESGDHTLKYFDSPRPMQRPKVSGLKESFKDLHILQESSRSSSEGKHVSSLKDPWRLSCDGRESRDASKSTIKLKELPRLSLDSRAGSIRGSTTEMKSNYLLGNLKKSNGRSNDPFNQQDEPECHTRLSNVVAKLMGLEALPDAMSTNENQTTQIKTHPDAENILFLGTSRRTDENKQTRFPGSPRNLHKEPISPRLRNDSVKKPIPNSKFPIEPQPWRQPHGSGGSQVTALNGWVTVPQAPKTTLSVYGEIEKRLAQLEFNKSGKDLRALKHILEAMQKTKEVLETKNEAAKLGTQRSSNSSVHESLKLSNMSNPQNNNPISATNTSTNLPKSFKSPIVIMKPAKLMQKASNTIPTENTTESISVLDGLRTADSINSRKESIGKQTAKDLTPRTNDLRDRSNPPSRLMDKNTAARLTRLSQTSKEPHSFTRESTNPSKSSGNFNVQQPQKKIGLGKQTRPTNPSADPIRTTRQSTRQPTESDSPRRKPRPKYSNLQPSYDELSDIGSYMKDSSYHADSISLQSESTISLASQVDEEVSSIDRSNKINNFFIQQAYQRHRKPVVRSVKDRSITQPATPSSEQPSPVSVLDATFYVDDLPSPIKKKPIAFKEDVERNPVDANESSGGTNYSLNSVTNHKKAESIHLVTQNFMQMLSVQKEPFNGEITSQYNSPNPDHQYILEILLASGFLEDFDSGFTSIHLHHTGYPINQDIFLPLEQVKASTTLSNDTESGRKTFQSEFHSKIQRKLVFDVVNEILIHKLFLESSSKHCCPPNSLANIGPRGQQLFGELCSEVDRLQGNASNFSLDNEDDTLTSILRADLMHQSTQWTACRSEIPGLVLDVERLIFKDLITEVVTCETLGLRGQSAGSCGQMFSKYK